MSKEHQHIVIVTSEFPPQPGGIGNHAYNLALYLSKHGYCVEVISDQRSSKGEEELRFDKTLPFAVKRVKRYNWRIRMYMRRLVLTYRAFKSASCVIATGKFSLWNVGFFSMFSNRKTLAIIHGTEVNFKSVLLRKSVDIALRKFDQVIAVSNYTKDLVAYLNLNITVIPNGIQFSNWSMTRHMSTTIKGKPILTTVGRVSARKGQLNVIRHLPEIIKHYPEVHYHCIGIPTEANDFKLVAKTLQVQDHITFHGSVDDMVLKEMLSQTDIFVMLSSESSDGDVEGFGIAILEANALGVPVIGSLGCGIEDAIKVKSSGLLIAHDSAEEMVTAISEILHRDIQYQNEAKQWAEQHDWTHIIKSYMALLE
ncbi:phosphatidylinositol alpha-1,6-mannosyltransferase [Formosa sp. Hel1_31_208]|uniref:glycosyltransferase family 4 protein n=1 Tax=Formosa sp. Hel1_31_208 TaxID=1798225 RepID=UPI000879DB5A|nr:glycosyltransferase family 4 protein [Formosa sp. Hel1_31_208]SDS68437.1 phosphatidylinositol alpha-1,6-mannosyltransferase [Formosa sp. Hel1_31_208]